LIRTVRVGKDLARIARLSRRNGRTLGNQAPRGTTDSRQFLFKDMGGRDQAQVDVEGLAGLFGRTNRGRQTPFFAVTWEVSHRPASCRMRLMVLGQTSGTQPLDLASSSARRCLPQSGCSWRRAMT